MRSIPIFYSIQFFARSTERCQLFCNCSRSSADIVGLYFVLTENRFSASSIFAIPTPTAAANAAPRAVASVQSGLIIIFNSHFH